MRADRTCVCEDDVQEVGAEERLVLDGGCGYGARRRPMVSHEG